MDHLEQKEEGEWDWYQENIVNFLLSVSINFSICRFINDFLDIASLVMRPVMKFSIGWTAVGWDSHPTAVEPVKNFMFTNDVTFQSLYCLTR